MEYQRIQSVDIAKGIGILLVVIGHLISEHTIPGRMIYAFHMPLFWFLSGLLLNKSGAEFHLKKKYNSLMIPCFSFTCICGLIEYYVLNNHSIFFNMSHELPGALWFLPILFLSTTIYLFVRRLFKKRLFLYLFILLMVYCAQFKFSESQLPYKLSYTPYSCVFLHLGYVFKNRLPQIFKYSCKKKFVFTLLAVSIYLLLIFLVLPICDIGFMYSLAAITVAICGIWLTLMTSELIVISRIRSFFEYLGKNTLVIMSVHVLYMHMCLFFIKDVVPVYLIYKILEISIISLLCYVSIECVNKYLPFLIGKNDPK